MRQITEMSDKFCSFKKCKKINSSYFEGTKNKKVIHTRYLFSFRKQVENATKWCDTGFAVTTIKTLVHWIKLTICTLYIRGFNKFGIKVSWKLQFLEYSQQCRVRTTSIYVQAFWNFKLKVLIYSRNCSLHNMYFDTLKSKKHLNHPTYML